MASKVGILGYTDGSLLPSYAERWQNVLKGRLEALESLSTANTSYAEAIVARNSAASCLAQWEADHGAELAEAQKLAGSTKRKKKASAHQPAGKKARH